MILQEGADVLGKGGKELAQRMLARLELRSNRNSVDLKNVTAPYWGWTNPVHQHRLRVSQMGKHFAEEDLGVLVGELTVRKQSRPVASWGVLPRSSVR